MFFCKKRENEKKCLFFDEKHLFFDENRRIFEFLKKRKERVEMPELVLCKKLKNA